MNNAKTEEASDDTGNPVDANPGDKRNPGLAGAGVGGEVSLGPLEAEAGVGGRVGTERSRNNRNLSAQSVVKPEPAEEREAPKRRRAHRWI
jgi:hypothetical protein